MFYDKQNTINKESYKKMLEIIGSLSKLFSDDKSPYLEYRIHENCFCRYFSFENISRSDVSIDAKKDGIGIGLKTWTKNDDQKIAEFGKLRKQYCNLNGLDLVKEISSFRNERIRFAQSTYKIDKLLYHIVKRVPGEMQILEHAFDYIDIDHIRLLKCGKSNNTYFTDGKHTYHFSSSKNTLYMKFDKCELMDRISIDILRDPFNLIEKYYTDVVDSASSFQFEFDNSMNDSDILRDNQICLRLYSIKKGIKKVEEKSGLNQWAANGRKRNKDEVYIPYPSDDRKRNPNFFPDRKNQFDLLLPNSSHIKASICQDQGKAIMSNPNKALGQWLLRDLFNLKENELLTYEKLEQIGIDSVIFTKIDRKHYSIDFAKLGSYEKFYNIEDD